MLVTSSYPAMSTNRTWSKDKIEAKRLFALWLVENLERTGHSQNKLARLMGCSPSTVNRWVDPDDGTSPGWDNVIALATMFGNQPPGFAAQDHATGMAEDGLRMIAQPETDDWNGNITEWAVKDASMQVMGYMAGDMVRADARIKPEDGDVVVANLYSVNGQTATTALRVFKAPGYLLPATSNATEFSVHEVGKTGAIFGTVFESRRTRKAH
jgi:hypothetical protein